MRWSFSSSVRSSAPGARRVPTTRRGRPPRRAVHAARNRAAPGRRATDCTEARLCRRAPRIRDREAPWATTWAFARVWTSASWRGSRATTAAAARGSHSNTSGLVFGASSLVGFRKYPSYVAGEIGGGGDNAFTGKFAVIRARRVRVDLQGRWRRRASRRGRRVPRRGGPARDRDLRTRSRHRVCVHRGGSGAIERGGNDAPAA